MEECKITLLHGCSSRILNCTNDNKSRQTSQISIQMAAALKIIYIE